MVITDDECVKQVLNFPGSISGWELLVINPDNIKENTPAISHESVFRAT
jgi:aspartyl-tRNA synthetase